MQAAHARIRAIFVAASSLTHQMVQFSCLDCNKDSAFTIDDFICFQQAYALGC